MTKGKTAYRRVYHRKLFGIVCVISMVIIVSCNQQEAADPSNIPKQKASNTNTNQSNKKRLEKNFEQATQMFFKNRAIAATLFGVSDNLTGYHSKSSLENYSPKNEANFRESMLSISTSLNKLKVDSKIDQENHKVIANIIEYFSGAKGMPVGFIDAWMGHSAFIVNQINGPLLDIPNILINSHTIKTIDDADDYIQRLTNFSAMTNSINDKLKDDAKRGWIPPKIIVQQSINYLENYTQVDIAQTSLVTSFESKINQLENISTDQKTNLIEKVKQLVSGNVYAGYKKITKTMRTLLNKASTESGIWAQPKGEEFYRYSVSKLGDTDLTPEEIHKIGLQEVARITSEMDRILMAEGYKIGSVGQRMTALSKEDRFLYPNTDKGRSALINSLNATIKQMSKIMPTQFKSAPPYKVEVKRIPIATQDTSAGGYYTPPAMDGSVPGIYWINLRNTKANPKFDLKTLTFHEAIPGHHWQVALNLAQDQLPLLRRLSPFNAYTEGWALYSEQVAYEMGLYKDDPYGNLGRLKAELFRAVRLVVDTGMHAKKWSRERAIEYMASATGTEKSDVVSEIERYMVWPGQALGYKLGMLKILSLRKYAQNKLGIAFDIKEFHDVILLSGAVPMKILDENVKAWVETYL